MRKLRQILALMALAAASLIGVHAANLPFASQSQLASGRWVKIAVPTTGVYELSYDQLRALGFSNPEKVSVWGDGGIMYPMNFINSTTGAREIPDTMSSVGVWHTAGKLYFYGRGPQNMAWRQESSYDIPGRFANLGNNIYSTRGIYFLSDAQPTPKAVTTYSGSATESQPVESAYSYFHHEKDVTQGLSHSGQNFWGESFLGISERTRLFPYSAPMVKPGSKAIVNIRANVLTWLPSSMTVSLDGTTLGDCNFDARDGSGYTVEIINDRQVFGAGQPKAQGNVMLAWHAPACDLAQANLDYIVLTYERSLAFAEDENQFCATARVAEATGLRLPSEADVVCWDVTVPSQPQMLPASNGIAAAPAGDRDLVFFRTSALQMHPEIIGEVANSDLRGRLVTANPEYVFITTDEFRASAEKLAAFHRINDGAHVEVVTVQEIYNDFSAGRPDPMAYRSMLRMLYQQYGSRLRGVLLYGPQLSDIRGLNAENEREAIIVYQNPSSSHISSCIAFTDIYGIFSDTLFKYISTEQMSIAVAALPVQSLQEADRYYNKVVRYYFDDSRAYWMERMMFTADDYDKGAHLEQVDDLGSQLLAATDSTYVIDKVYFSEYGYPGVKQPMFNAFNEGAAYSLYIGHGSPLQIGHEAPLLNPSDIGNFRNRRLGFMSFASCETTLYEVGNRGVSEHMVFSTEDGLIGMLGTVRTAFSGDNLGCMRQLNNMLYQLPRSNKGNTTEFGELVRRAKNNVTGYEGKYKFQLMVDPLLRLMLPTMNLTMAQAPVSAKVGEEVKFEGHVSEPGGASVSDFNGTVVLKWYKPEWDSQRHYKVSNNPGSEYTFRYGHEVLATQAFNVTNGKFSIADVVPSILNEYAGQELRVTLTAYDADRRLGATWSGKTMVETAASGSTQDTELPVIGIMEAEGMEGVDMLPSDFTLRIEATDNTGLRMDEKAFDAPLLLSIDGKTAAAGVANYVTITDGARTMLIRYPMSKISVGCHTATITVTDYAGNTATREFIFEVGSSADIDAPILAETACVKQATMSLTDAVMAEAKNPVLVITDAMGQELLSEPWQGTEHTWRLIDKKGKRVEPGLYKAYVRFTDEHGRSAVTRGTYLPVLP